MKKQTERPNLHWMLLSSVIILLCLAIFILNDNISKTNAKTAYDLETISNRLQNLSNDNAMLIEKVRQQTVPFCRMTSSTGQIGVGIKPEMLNETCQ